MLMGREQMAVLHSFFIKELREILQLHLATQKESPPFASEMQVFPCTENQTEGGGGFVELIPMLFPGSVFASCSQVERGRRTRGWMRTFWGVSTPQGCHPLFGVQSP